jgi:hypothetical protein
MRKRHPLPYVLGLVCGLVAGCAQDGFYGHSAPLVRGSEVQRLLALKDSPDAFKAAPVFTEEALKTVARLQHDLESPR